MSYLSAQESRPADDLHGLTQREAGAASPPQGVMIRGAQQQSKERGLLREPGLASERIRKK